MRKKNRRRNAAVSPVASGIQILERKSLLSVGGGNVTATRDRASRTVTLTGDAADNEIELVQNKRGGLSIQAIDQVGSQDTTINGKRRIPLGWTIRFDLQAGNDRIRLRGNYSDRLNVSSKLEIATGDGADYVSVEYANVGAAITFTPGANPWSALEKDQLYIHNSHVMSVAVDTTGVSDGHFQTTVSNSTVVDGFTYTGGEGTDSVSVNSSVLKTFRVNTGAKTSRDNGTENINIHNSHVMRLTKIRTSNLQSRVYVNQSRLRVLDAELGENIRSQFYIWSSLISRGRIDGSGGDLISGSNNLFRKHLDIFGFRRNQLR